MLRGLRHVQVCAREQSRRRSRLICTRICKHGDSLRKLRGAQRRWVAVPRYACTSGRVLLHRSRHQYSRLTHSHTHTLRLKRLTSLTGARSEPDATHPPTCSMSTAAWTQRRSTSTGSTRMPRMRQRIEAREPAGRWGLNGSCRPSDLH